MDFQLDENSNMGSLHAIRCEGNVLFKKGDWPGAFAKYSECIDEAVIRGESLKGRSAGFVKEMMLAYSNRAEVMLRLKVFESAFDDAMEALELDPTHIKSLSRLGLATRELGLYEESCQTFATAVERLPDDQSLKKQLKESRILLKKHNADIHGEKSSINPEGDRPEGTPETLFEKYVALVEIRRVNYGDGRRGLFAKQHFEVMERILWSRPMAVASKDPRSDANAKDGRSESNSGIQDDHGVLGQVLWQVATSQRSKAQLYSLASAGQGEMEIPKMELFLPESDWAPPEASRPGFDVRLLEQIVHKNLTCAANVQFSFASSKGLAGRGEAGKDGSSVWGLWILPSFINHSCAPNCMQHCMGSLFGNPHFVNATRETEPGEELTINYLEPDDLLCGVEDRQKRAQDLHFTCACERCTLELPLKDKLSQLRFLLRVLVPGSKRDFARGWGCFLGIEGLGELVNRANVKFSSMKVVFPQMYEEPGDFSTFLRDCHSRGYFLPTKKLAEVANCVEMLIESSNVAANQRCWIRASFLEAYLAKYQQAALGMDAGPRIDALKVILNSIMSVSVAGVQSKGSAVMLTHLLWHEVKSSCDEESEVYKSNKKFVERALSIFMPTKDHPKEAAEVWDNIDAKRPTYDYSEFCFRSESESI